MGNTVSPHQMVPENRAARAALRATPTEQHVRRFNNRTQQRRPHPRHAPSSPPPGAGCAKFCATFGRCSSTSSSASVALECVECTIDRSISEHPSSGGLCCTVAACVASTSWSPAPRPDFFSGVYVYACVCVFDARACSLVPATRTRLKTARQSPHRPRAQHPRRQHGVFYSTNFQWNTSSGWHASAFWSPLVCQLFACARAHAFRCVRGRDFVDWAGRQGTTERRSVPRIEYSALLVLILLFSDADAMRTRCGTRR